MAIATPDVYPGIPGSFIRAGIPIEHADKPRTLKLYDWSNFASPSLVATMIMNTPIQDLVFQDTRLNAEFGAIQVTQSNQSMVYAGFEFGATLFEIGSHLNDESIDSPVFQLLIACTPHGRWATFPAADTYNAATDSTIPPPFKIEVLNAVGTLLHTYELRDGLAINDTRRTTTRSSTQPSRPWFNVGMMLPWQSSRLKVSSDLNYWFPGVTEDSIHPRNAKEHYSVNPAIPYMADRFQINGGLHWHALPRWPMPYDDVFGSTPEYNALDPNNDPDLFAVTKNTGTGITAKSWRFSGWDYEPGSISGHDWMPGPGGQRFDRAWIPSVLSLFATHPTGVRPKNNEPLRDMAEAWTKAYFNHSFHYVRNPKTFALLPDDQILARGWSYGGAYYGTGFNYVPGGNSRHVATHGIPQSGDWPPADKDGRRHYNGTQFDDQHNYSTPGWSVLLLNSPMHVLSQKARFASNTMSWLGAGTTALYDMFGFRQHAWRWNHYCMTWILGSSHPFAHTRANIETMMAQELEAIYDTLYVPAIINNDTGFMLTTLRNLGCTHLGATSNSGSGTYYAMPTPLWLYIVGPIFMMKRSGMLAVMKARNAKCLAAINFVIECLDKYCCDFIVGTNGRAEFTDNGANMLSTAGTTPVMPTSWANWAVLHPAVGSEDWVHDSAGALLERYAAQHLRAQWAFIRRDYLADENPGRANINEACTLYQGFYDTWAAANKAWIYRIPGQGIVKAGF